jgi:hypothetical protein
MATLVDLSGYSYGVTSAETSMEIKNFTVQVAPQFKTMVQDRSNSNKGFVAGPPRSSISIQGDVSATSSGWWDWTFVTAITIANDTTVFGAGATGGVYLDSATVTEAYDQVKTISAELSCDLGVT